MVQWLGLRASIAAGTGLIPGRGTKIPQALWLKKKKKKSQFEEARTSVLNVEVKTYRSTPRLDKIE